MKIEGVPEGWELVRVGIPKEGECYINTEGRVVNAGCAHAADGYAIVRKIEKTKRYRPFASSEEFVPFRDKWIQSIDNDGYWQVCGYNSHSIYIDFHTSETFVDAFSDYTFEDGQPFGIEVTE